MQTVQIRAQLCITGKSLTNAFKAPIKLLISLDCFIVSLCDFLSIRPCVSSIKSSRSFLILVSQKRFRIYFWKCSQPLRWFYLIEQGIGRLFGSSHRGVWNNKVVFPGTFEAMFAFSNSCRTKHSTFELLFGSDETSNEDFKSNVAR